MTKTEYEAVRSLYLKLLDKGKENRTEVEEAQYLYTDKLLNYISLRAQAKNMGNKNPDDNFLVKSAKKNMELAQAHLKEVIGK